MKVFMIVLASVGWFQVSFRDVVNVPHTKIVGAIDRQDAIDSYNATEAKSVPVEFRLRASHREWYVSYNETSITFSNRKEHAKVMRSFDELTEELAIIYRCSKDHPFIVIEKSHPTDE